MIVGEVDSVGLAIAIGKVNNLAPCGPAYYHLSKANCL